MKKKSLIFAFVLGSVLLFLVGCRAVDPNNPIPYDNAPTANTTEMVDYLSKVAKEDAKSTAVSDSVAIDFIRNTYPNFYIKPFSVLLKIFRKLILNLFSNIVNSTFYCTFFHVENISYLFITFTLYQKSNQNTSRNIHFIY